MCVYVHMMVPFPNKLGILSSQWIYLALTEDRAPQNLMFSSSLLFKFDGADDTTAMARNTICNWDYNDI